MVVAVASATSAILTWEASAGAARSARVDIGSRPLFALVAIAALAVLVTLRRQTGDDIFCAIALAGVGVCALGDARTGFVFDRATMMLVAVLLTLALPRGIFLSCLMNGLLVAAPLGTLYALTRGGGIGLGDVKLAVPIGMGLGVHTGIDAIGVAFVVGATVCVIRIAFRHTRTTAVAFAPFLAIGAALAIPLCGVLP